MALRWALECKRLIIPTDKWTTRLRGDILRRSMDDAFTARAVAIGHLTLTVPAIAAILLVPFFGLRMFDPVLLLYYLLAGIAMAWQWYSVALPDWTKWLMGKAVPSDRYYAAHLFGDLKDVRAVPILTPLLKDNEVNWIVPWALGEIGDKSAVPPLVQTLNDKSPDMRVLAIYALESLKATQALPQLHLLPNDDEKIHFDGSGTVAEAAKAAIAKLDAKP